MIIYIIYYIYIIYIIYIYTKNLIFGFVSSGEFNSKWL
jgi:hypothetical protein